jgi:hypothetical protein
VAIGELGTIKMEIAFLGDTMNTAARLQQACRDTGQRVLASAALVNRLAALPPGIAKRSIGRLRLRGKENEIELYALAAAVSATSASPHISHYLCMIWQICEERCLLFCRRGTPGRLETRECLNDYLTTKVAKRSRRARG